MRFREFRLRPSPSTSRRINHKPANGIVAGKFQERATIEIHDTDSEGRRKSDIVVVVVGVMVVVVGVVVVDVVVILVLNIPAQTN